MVKKPDGDPAFPDGAVSGMSLRDYIAAQIAAGDAAADEGWSGNNIADESLQNRARLYYRIADAMIKVRDE
jgi:hypothetical protein